MMILFPNVSNFFAGQINSLGLRLEEKPRDEGFPGWAAEYCEMPTTTDADDLLKSSAPRSMRVL